MASISAPKNLPFAALLRRSVVGAMAGTCLLLAAGARAQIAESLSASSNYTYDLVPGMPGLNSGTGNTGVFHVDGSDPAKATDIQINYASIATTSNDFFFLHNIQCKGYCSIGVNTVVVDTITNNGPGPVNLRLDSNITAGHFGLVQNAKSPSAGIFRFDITQTTSGTGHQLYQALGQISSSGATISTSNGSVFNNVTSYQDPAQIGLDWDETPLSVLLDPLAPGETTTVTYASLTYLNAYGQCTDVTLCDGVQVAFGDPRNNGGVIGQAVRLLSPSHEPVGWVLDRGFDMAIVDMRIVNLSAAPEPASWAMMLGGFGMTGAVLRARRRPRRAAA